VLGGGLSADTSTQARLQLYGSALDAALTHPEGIGWGNLWTHIPAWALLDSGYRQYPHNLLIEVITEAGWLAGIALVVVLVAALRRARWHMTSATGRAVFALLMFFLLNAMVSGDINDNRFFFALVAIALALPRRGEAWGEGRGTADPGEPQHPPRPQAPQQAIPSPMREGHRTVRTTARR
jgi:O-antigen ligase